MTDVQDDELEELFYWDVLCTFKGMIAVFGIQKVTEDLKKIDPNLSTEENLKKIKAETPALLLPPQGKIIVP